MVVINKEIQGEKILLENIDFRHLLFLKKKKKIRITTLEQLLTLMVCFIFV